MQDKSTENSDILTEKEDIIIALTDYVENSGKSKLTIRYATLDTELKFAKGLTKKYLEEVIDKAGFEIENQTESQIVLIKKPPVIFAWN